MSDFGTSSATGVSFDPERPPQDLSVDFRYTKGGMMSKYDVWSAITESIAGVGQLVWNGQVVGSMKMSVSPNVEVRFVSSVEPPRYQTKTIMWTLVEAFDYYNSQQHYANCFLKTHIGRGPAAQTLGVASIKSTLSTLPVLQTNSSALTLANETSFEPSSSTLALSTSTQTSSNQSLLSSSLHVDTDLSLYLEYLKPSAAINDKAFFGLIINVLVFAAQHDPKSAPCGTVQAYNSMENYTFIVGPTSGAARTNLPWSIAIAAIGFLPSEMMRHEGRWAELTGRIKLGGTWVGKILILKGDHRVPSAASCGVGWSGDEDGRDSF